MQRDSVTGELDVSPNLDINELCGIVWRQRWQALCETLDILLCCAELMIVWSPGLENLHDELPDHGERILTTCQPHLHSFIRAIIDALNAKERLASFAQTEGGNQAAR